MPTKISAEVKGLKETQRNLENAVKGLQGTPMLNAMRDATLYVERSAKINAPVDTGRLRASITPEIRVERETIQGVVGTNVEYAPIQEFGSLNKLYYYILPKSKKVLKFKIGGRTIFAKYVIHPPIKGLHYLQRAFDSNKGKIEARFQKAVDQITRDANK